MNEKPIIFSTSMVKAILDGRKTQTRRVVKPQPTLNIPLGFCTGATDGKNIGKFGFGLCGDGGQIKYYKPKYQVGDILWVRETWKPSPYDDGVYAYKANGLPEPAGCQYLNWRPSIHMPRAAARIFLRVTDVRVERLQDISETDAKAEGITVVTNNSGLMYCRKFRDLWDKINGKRDKGAYKWDSNPWVWVIEFEPFERVGENDE